MRFFLIFLFLPLQLFSQDIQGVWTGTIYNDSTQKYIPYEVAISEVNGKLSGYSHTVFTDENNRQETGVKSLRIKKKGDKILIEDDGLIYNNYITPPPKGVRQYSVLSFTDGPHGKYLVGVFNTNRTKEYASVTGSINLQKKEKITESSLMPVLEELNLSNSLSFNQRKEDNKNNVVVAPLTTDKTPVTQPLQERDLATRANSKNKTASVVKIEKDENLIDINQDTVDYKVDVIENAEVTKLKKQKREVVKAPTITLPKTTSLPEPKDQTVNAQENKTATIVQPKKEVVIVPLSDQKKSQAVTHEKQIPVTQPKNDIAGNTSKIETKPVVVLPPKEKPTPIVQVPVKKPEVTSQSTAKEQQPQTKKEVPSRDKTQETVTVKLPPTVQMLPASPVFSSAELAKRKIETIRSVDVKSDSIVLTLYDNGVIDGDTVSVILNGRTILSKQRLTESALSKTVYMTPDLGDSLQLIMFAENLGTIAPNTGLLIIQDGDERHEVRFSGDLQKNSAIVLRRKKN
jgi:hypothetical protein